MSDKWMQVIRFLLVGVLNTSIDLAVFFILTFTGFPVLPAQFVSYSLGMLNSYLLNRTWTFKRSEKQGVKEPIKFICLNLLTIGVVSFMLNGMVECWNQPLVISKVFATLIGLCVNYIGSRYWVFRSSKRQKSTE